MWFQSYCDLQRIEFWAHIFIIPILSPHMTELKSGGRGGAFPCTQEASQALCSPTVEVFKSRVPDG